MRNKLAHLIVVGTAVGCCFSACSTDERSAPTILTEPSRQIEVSPPSPVLETIEDVSQQALTTSKEFSNEVLKQSLPKHVTLRLTVDSADYVRGAGKHSAEELTLRAAGIAFDFRQILIDPERSRWIVWLLNHRGTFSGTLPASAYNAAEVLIHEVVHTLGGSGEIAPFARAMEEGLTTDVASETAALFVKWLMPLAKVGTTRPSTSTIDLLHNGAYRVDQEGWAHSQDVRFSTIALVAGGQCENDEWWQCALRYKTERRPTIARALKDIVRQHPACGRKSSRKRLSIALYSGSAPRLSWALSHCLGGQNTQPDIACEVLVTKGLSGLSYPYLDLSIHTSLGFYTRRLRLRNVHDDAEFELTPPLTFTEDVRGSSAPYFVTQLVIPDPGDARRCVLAFDRNFQCGNVKLGFESEERPVTIVFKQRSVYHQETVAPPVALSHLINVPVLAGTEVFVSLGNAQLPVKLTSDGDTCWIRSQ